MLRTFQTELVIKFWVIPLFCKLWNYLSMLTLILDNVALLGEEYKSWPYTLIFFLFPSTALRFWNKHNMHPLFTDEMDVRTEMGINDVISAVVSRVSNFSLSCLILWVDAEIFFLQSRSDKYLVAITKFPHSFTSHVRVAIATKEWLLGYSQIHYVAIITSRPHCAGTFKLARNFMHWRF
jgi:hypothetical protein